MKSIRISDEVWAEIARRGKFGETEEDVLRRIFGLSEGNSEEIIFSKSSQTRGHYATDRLSAGISGNKYVLKFASGQKKEIILPDRSDREGIKKLTDEAIKFVRDAGGTIGQINAARKGLTDHGFRISKW
jgi:hypothetical protein